jgi:hypothetical protein
VYQRCWRRGAASDVGVYGLARLNLSGFRTGPPALPPATGHLRHPPPQLTEMLWPQPTRSTAIEKRNTQLLPSCFGSWPRKIRHRRAIPGLCPMIVVAAAGGWVCGVDERWRGGGHLVQPGVDARVGGGDDNINLKNDGGNAHDKSGWCGGFRRTLWAKFLGFPTVGVVWYALPTSCMSYGVLGMPCH